MAANDVVPLLKRRWTVPRKKKPEPRSQLATYIPASLHDSVRLFSEESGIPIARIVEDALRSYLADKPSPESKEKKR